MKQIAKKKTSITYTHKKLANIRNEREHEKEKATEEKKLFNWIPLYLFVLFVSIDK